MHPYQSYVLQFARLKKGGTSLPLGGFEPLPGPSRAGGAPKALIFSPHPDDECIIGALPLRLMREGGYDVINIAVTLGSKKERKAERYGELEAACQFLGFGLRASQPNGMEGINIKTRKTKPAEWVQSVQIIARQLLEHRPRVIFFPHDEDWNSTHIGTHCLVMDALFSLGETFSCLAVETEFWGQMKEPNLMVESGPEAVADLVAAVSFHAGEVRRNPYHLLLPAWMQDNVRRGGELVGGQGAAAPEFDFATLYRLRRWKNQRLENLFEGGKFLSVRSSAAELFLG